MPAEANASLDASRARSSTPLVHASVKGVQPIPTIATRSLMPWLPMVQASDVMSVVAAARTGRAFQK